MSQGARLQLHHLERGSSHMLLRGRPLLQDPPLGISHARVMTMMSQADNTEKHSAPFTHTTPHGPR